ncbi:sigma-70 family RNA polymerase sigma factor [Amphritea sp. RP18W]|uniref:Sigma-70 family RNA polymerase sigma factor n=1 Tax=Amphritea pacifica TaxID=2811233 RepID=A0ABS2W4P1_9GAMM|nr:sigma-70 family RNA polymerase sigma factor [Amphritea pacifica]
MSQNPEKRKGTDLFSEDGLKGMHSHAGAWERVNPDRNEAMIKAYQSQHYTLKEIGEHFGISYSTVSRAVNRDAKRKT